MSNLTLSEYQQRTTSTAVYPGAREKNLIGLNYAGLGASNEAGEIAGKIKKIWRDDDGVVTDEKRIAIAGEVGDVLWYLGQVADQLGLDLGAIAEANLAKLADRKARGVIGGSGDNR
jgi:NTP pyrophosphatase (non-canonical NTP hydrolase)